MRRHIIGVLLVAIAFSAAAQDWTETVVEDMTVRHAIVGSELFLSVSAPTTGWVAIGFEPTRAMADANILIGYVDGNQVVVEDHYGNGIFSHRPDTRLGGDDNVTVIGGSETNRATTIEFSIPLNSGDQYDKVLTAGQTAHVILAWGANDNTGRQHRRRYSTTIQL